MADAFLYQENRPIFTITISFHKPEPGPDFSFPFEDMRAYLRFRLADVVFNGGKKSGGMHGLGIPSAKELIDGGTYSTVLDAGAALRTPP